MCKLDGFTCGHTVKPVSVTLRSLCTLYLTHLFSIFFAHLFLDFDISSFCSSRKHKITMHFSFCYRLGLRAPALNHSLCHSSWEWESLNFNVSRRTKLFLTLKDFFWHKNTVNLKLPYGITDSEVTLQKTLAGLTDYDMLESTESLSCRRCVVVGNGHSLKNSSLGSVINQYDVVIRLNNAPTRGYEEDVGNKTTMRFFYPESASHNPGTHNQPDTLMVLVPFKHPDLLWLKWILYNEKRVKHGFWRPPPLIWMGKTSQLRVLDPFFMYMTASRLLNIPTSVDPSIKKVVNYVHPTTGILAVYVALNYCNVVHLAGFGYPRADEREQLIHYYGDDTMMSMMASIHNISKEAQALKSLEDSGAILHLRPLSG
ncbi:CMP-N-acetylneuraminate-beta-galactosamide-alpha-2,3-sialyltransferase 4-like isoform X1 [Scleropages formosus]|uniref:CMP-N-acetylneuraminate-beta-galactosamide-alpha-2,3-sialyltransferase 4 n=1 Tax=Scleropages formosus TaxID=113540 RepID=A0A8C9VHX3_SCLFO|nr:CMP-N-acetylneuraminate-beta-galactosamide-alpha-2,3-sialyltransferase 4 isoform X1 [Scleropages formosus]